MVFAIIMLQADRVLEAETSLIKIMMAFVITATPMVKMQRAAIFRIKTTMAFATTRAQGAGETGNVAEMEMVAEMEISTVTGMAAGKCS